MQLSNEAVQARDGPLVQGQLGSTPLVQRARGESFQSRGEGGFVRKKVVAVQEEERGSKRVGN